MDKNQFIRDFAEAIDRSDPIRMEDEFRNYDEWSSISYLRTIVMMAEFGAEMDESEFRKLRTVQDLYNRVK